MLVPANEATAEVEVEEVARMVVQGALAAGVRLVPASPATEHKITALNLSAGGNGFYKTLL